MYDKKESNLFYLFPAGIHSLKSVKSEYSSFPDRREGKNKKGGTIALPFFQYSLGIFNDVVHAGAVRSQKIYNLISLHL